MSTEAFTPKWQKNADDSFTADLSDGRIAWVKASDRTTSDGEPFWNASVIDRADEIRPLRLVVGLGNAKAAALTMAAMHLPIGFGHALLALVREIADTRVCTNMTTPDSKTCGECVPCRASALAAKAEALHA